LAEIPGILKATPGATIQVLRHIQRDEAQAAAAAVNIADRGSHQIPCQGAALHQAIADKVASPQEVVDAGNHRIDYAGQRSQQELVHELGYSD